MMRTMLLSKLHQATVTEANLNYVGSITIAEDLLIQSGILINEKVQIVNNNNGARFETYVIAGEKNSGVICLNGAAARLAVPGDQVIIMNYGLLTEEEIKQHQPTVIVLDESNQPKQILKRETHSTLIH